MKNLLKIKLNRKVIGIIVVVITLCIYASIWLVGPALITPNSDNQNVQDLRALIVTRDPIAKGSIISSQALIRVETDISPPPNAITSFAEAHGKRATVEIAPGQFITTDMFQE